jgi:hypothetical protein
LLEKLLDISKGKNVSGIYYDLFYRFPLEDTIKYPLVKQLHLDLSTILLRKGRLSGLTEKTNVLWRESSSKFPVFKLRSLSKTIKIQTFGSRNEKRKVWLSQ